MGWVWRDEPDDIDSSAPQLGEFKGSDNGYSGDRCSTRKVVKSQCRTEEVEPGKFLRKCEKTEQVLRECVGRPPEVLESNQEYTEDDVTDQVLKGSSFVTSEQGSFDFPGLRSDLEAIERSVFGNLNRFFEAAEEMRNGFFAVFGDPTFHDGSSTTRRGVPIEDHPQRSFPKPKETGSP